MHQITCTSCELPNAAGSLRCHACGAVLPGPDGAVRGSDADADADAAAASASADEIDEAESELWEARNVLADLEWKVRGAGTLALAMIGLTYLAVVSNVSHPVFGSKVLCGTPLGAQFGSYESKWSVTMWSGCAEAARGQRPTIVLFAVLAFAGATAQAVRGARIRAARSRVVRSLARIHELRDVTAAELGT